jgi:2-amino-4-hydroxy-6-hydroxymethyldihydropteridine diphosphokinase
MTESIAYIGLGSNQGNRKQFIESALKAISHIEGVKFLRSSRVIETKALSVNPQPEFLNAVMEVETKLSPADLLKQLQSIENQLGRVRAEKWGPRTIDLDILLYGDSVIEQQGLSIPHKQLHLRSFVLNGLCELCPDRLHPVMKVSFGQLLEQLNGCDFVIDPNRSQLISITGPIGVGKSTLAANLMKYIEADGIYEEYDKNPYMPRVYEGKRNWLSIRSCIFCPAVSNNYHTKPSKQGGFISAIISSKKP